MKTAAVILDYYGFRKQIRTGKRINPARVLHVPVAGLGFLAFILDGREKNKLIYKYYENK